MAALVTPGAHIERLERDALEIGERIRVCVADLVSSQLTWHPPEGGWSVAECLEHLTITNGLYVEATEVVLAGTPQIDPAMAPDFKPGPIAARFIRMLEPGKGRYKAPKPFQPTRDLARADAVARFFEVHSRVCELIGRLRFMDLTRTRVASPVSPMIRFRIGDMMDVVLVHSKRHVLQAEKVKLRLDFPGTSVETDANAKEE